MATYRSLPQWPHEAPKKLPKKKVTKKETTTSRCKVVIHIRQINDLGNLAAHTIVKTLPGKKTPTLQHTATKVRLPVAVKQQNMYRTNQRFMQNTCSHDSSIV